MAQTERLSRLMRLSWDIQKRKRYTRSKALICAWLILGTEDITVQYLTRKLNHHKPVKWEVLNQMHLFNS